MSEETNPVEQEAIELGWQPKEQFEADPKNEGKRWRSAEDFMDRKPLFDKIDQQGRELKEMKKAIASLANQNKEVEKLAYKKALEDLKAMKVAALEEGNHAKVVEIDEQIADIKATPITPVDPNAPHPEFQKWVEKNDWYKNDQKLRNVADGIGLSLARDGTPPTEIMDLVEKQIKQLYPEKFGRRTPPNPEGGGTRKSGSTNVESLLTEQELRIMKTIVNTGVSKEDYIKQFVEINPERFKGVKL